MLWQSCGKGHLWSANEQHCGLCVSLRHCTPPWQGRDHVLPSARIACARTRTLVPWSLSRTPPADQRPAAARARRPPLRPLRAFLHSAASAWVARSSPQTVSMGFASAAPPSICGSTWGAVSGVRGGRVGCQRRGAPPARSRAGAAQTLCPAPASAPAPAQVVSPPLGAGGGGVPRCCAHRACCPAGLPRAPTPSHPTPTPQIPGTGAAPAAPGPSPRWPPPACRPAAARPPFAAWRRR